MCVGLCPERLWVLIAIDNIFAVAFTFVMVYGLGNIRRYLWLAPMIYMMFRSLFSIFLFTPTVAIIVNFILGLSLLISLLFLMCRLDVKLFNDTSIVFSVCTILWLWMVGHLTWIATITYMVFFVVLWVMYRDLPTGLFFITLIFSLSWFTDVRELVIICWYMFWFHFPVSFLVIGKYFIWLALIPVLYKFGLLARSKYDILVGLMYTLLANIMQLKVGGKPLLFGFPLLPYELIVRMLPLGTILLLISSPEGRRSPYTRRRRPQRMYV